MIQNVKKRYSMKTISKEVEKEILSKTYLTMADVYKLLPIGKNQSDKLFRQIEAKAKADGKKLFITRPRVIPTYLFVEYIKQEGL